MAYVIRAKENAFRTCPFRAITRICVIKLLTSRFDMDMLMTLGGPDIGEDTEILVRFFGNVQRSGRMQGTMTMSANNIEVETQVVVIGDMLSCGHARISPRR